MLIKFLTGVFVFLLVITARAQEPSSVPSTYKIRQIILDQNIVVAESSNPNEVLKPGKLFLATFPNDKQCSLTMKEKNGSLIVLSTSTCGSAQEITKATSIEPALIDVAPTPAAMPPPQPTDLPKVEKTFKHAGLSLHYSLANELNFKEVMLTSSSGSGKVEVSFDLENAAGFGLSFVEMAPQNWGYMANAFYETGRKVKGMTVSGPGGSVSAVSSGGETSKISFFVLEGNLVHRWETFYLPFGLNVSIADISNAGSGVTCSGSVGVFVGGGFLLDEHSSFEFFMRGLGMQIKQVSGTTSLDYQLGTLTGIGLGYKYWF